VAAAGGKAAVRRAGEGKARRRGARPEAVDPGGGARRGAPAGTAALASSPAPADLVFLINFLSVKIFLVNFFYLTILFLEIFSTTKISLEIFFDS